MSLIIPDAREVEVLTQFLTPALTLKLYGNNYTPVAASIAANFTEIAGGGYASKSLLFANWTITGGTPSIALYAFQEWTFTGVLTAPATIYGYFVVETVSGLLKWADRFPAANVPFSPIAGSIIRVIPRVTAESA